MIHRSISLPATPEASNGYSEMAEQMVETRPGLAGIYCREKFYRRGW